MRVKLCVSEPIERFLFPLSIGGYEKAEDSPHLSAYYVNRLPTFQPFVNHCWANEAEAPLLNAWW
jgi:hypothetical protein